MNDLNDLTLVLQSRFPIVIVETQEEQRLLTLLARACNLAQTGLFAWSVADGLRVQACDVAPTADDSQETRDLTDALRHIDRSLMTGVYVLFDAHPFLDNPANQRLVKEIALAYPQHPRTLVMVGSRVQLPAELKRMSARFELSLPDLAQLQALLREEAQAYNSEPRLEKLKAEPEAVQLLLQHLHGQTLEDARRLIRQAIRDDGVISRADITRVLKLKHETLEGGGLSLELDCGSFAGVGGLTSLKRWLDRRKAAFCGQIAGLEPPRGVLLLGVQGAGKSLSAKAIAGSWGLPLLRLDFGTLYSKWSGETEGNLRASLRTAEAMAPCVLWIDEIEKGIAPDSGAGDAGVSQRVMATLLTWMSERKSRVFLAATANDISALPPELMRKGRFDEIFFVDLPEASVRADILRIHLAARGLDPGRFDLADLAQASAGFAGAELEQSIVSGLYEAAARSTPLDGAILREEIGRTRPLSVVMAESIERLRAWARDRTVPAS